MHYYAYMTFSSGFCYRLGLIPHSCCSQNFSRQHAKNRKPKRVRKLLVYDFEWRNCEEAKSEARKENRLLSNKLEEKFMFSLLCAFNENTNSIDRRWVGVVKLLIISFHDFNDLPFLLLRFVSMATTCQQLVCMRLLIESRWPLNSSKKVFILNHEMRRTRRETNTKKMRFYESFQCFMKNLWHFLDEEVYYFSSNMRISLFPPQWLVFILVYVSI
jgi:hypothetical protein